MAKAKRITSKQVKATEAKPFKPAIVPVNAEPDEDALQPEDGLTLRQRQFVRALVGPAGGNATRAAEMAGYRAENRNSLTVTAHETLTKPKVQEAIAHAYARQRMTPEWARATLFELASTSMAKFLKTDEHGNAVIDWKGAMAEGAIGGIREYTEDAIGDVVVRRKIKLVDRTKAAELVLKHFGMLTEKVEHTGPGGGPVQVQAVRSITEQALSDPETLKLLTEASKRLGTGEAK